MIGLAGLAVSIAFVLFMIAVTAVGVRRMIRHADGKEPVWTPKLRTRPPEHKPLLKLTDDD